MPSPKQPTSLSTPRLAAFLTWKQRDVLVILNEHPGGQTARDIGVILVEIADYDERHGGAFYKGTTAHGAYGCLLGLEKRGYVIYERFEDEAVGRWMLTDAGRVAVAALELNLTTIGRR